MRFVKARYRATKKENRKCTQNGHTAPPCPTRPKKHAHPANHPYLAGDCESNVKSIGSLIWTPEEGHQGGPQKMHNKKWPHGIDRRLTLLLKRRVNHPGTLHLAAHLAVHKSVGCQPPTQIERQAVQRQSAHPATDNSREGACVIGILGNDA